MGTLTPEVETSGRRVNGALAIVVFLVFAWLAERHVGDSVFLEDQVDQLQNFESLLQLRPEGLWGAVMSDTRPPARALGPLGALVFGLPVALGLGIDSIHFITSLLITLGTLIGFLTLSRLNRAFAWLWLLIFSATGIVWWNAGLFWVNTLLLPAGVILLALAASCLRYPTSSKLALLILTLIFALQVHLIAIVAASVVFVVAAVTARQALEHRPGRLAAGVLAVLALAAVGPYLLAESSTGFQNTRAIFMHLSVYDGGGRTQAIATAGRTLAIASDPMGLAERLAIGNAPLLTVGGIIGAAALVVLGTPLRRSLLTATTENRTEWAIFWLTLSAVAGVIAQAMFFLLTKRPLGGLHYITLLSPFYAVVPAAMLNSLLFRRTTSHRVAIALGSLCLAFLLLAGPSLGDRFLPPTQWSYKRITDALETLCAGTAVDTFEGAGFAEQLNPRYDGVLRYLMNRRFSSCRYEPGSDLLIVASQDGQYGEWYTVRGARYRLEVVLPPGIARYRRWH